MFNFQEVLNSSPQIKDFFSNNANTTQQYLVLAIQLILNSIQKRKQTNTTQNRQTKNKSKKQNKQNKQHNPHYNVAYIKHHRFLSPNQKKQITPKVTEIIPVSPQKIFIYGKPKVKLDEGYGCVLHQENCEEYYEQNQQFSQKHEKQNAYPAHQSDYQGQMYSKQLPHQYEEYLSPKNKHKKKGNKNQANINSNQSIGTIRSPNNKNKTRNSNRMTSPKSFINGANQINSENYSNVESKIKQLIQRDKKNRQIEKQVERQKQQISAIQERQNKLFLMQKYQQGLLKQDDNSDQDYQNQIWKITTTNSPQHVLQNNFQEDQSMESSSSESVVNLHGHKEQSSRIECYECQIQRLRRRKQKAKQAIKVIEKQEIRRSKLLGSIAMNSQVYRDIGGINRSSDQSHNSITLQ